MMDHKKIQALLAAYCEGLLPDEQLQFIDEHIAGCESCRAACREIRSNVQAMNSLSAEQLSEEASRRIRIALRQQALLRRSGESRARWFLAAAAAAVLLVAGIYFQTKQQVELKLSSGGPSELEQLAVRAHRQRADSSLALDYRTSSPGAARLWMQENGLVVADLALERPVEDGQSYQLEGISKVESNGHAAVLVAYRVDSHMVTLVAGRSADFSDHPPEAYFAKRIFYHTDASGQKIITWSISGKSYSLVSDLPGFGEQGCFLCHTEPSRRKAIRSLSRRESGN